MTTLVFIAIGSALGAPARYLLDRLIQSRRELVFPWGTWTINITGCFALGVLTGVADRHVVDAALLAATTTGFLGAYTTFSTFTWETMRLVEERALLEALLNVTVSATLGAAAAATGLLLGAV
ncbi:MAG: fluoride efflux transporter CrcB [Nocardioidaceae bacterium]